MDGFFILKLSCQFQHFSILRMNEKIDQNRAKNFVHGYKIEKHGIFVQAKTLHFENFVSLKCYYSYNHKTTPSILT